MRALILAGVLALACGPAAALSLPDWLGLGGQADKPAAPAEKPAAAPATDQPADKTAAPAKPAAAARP